MKFSDLKNESDNKFVDISSEEYRLYEFAASTVRINEPLGLAVSDSGGHRVFDASGKSHYIPSGWVHLEWKSKDGSPHFVK